MMFFLFACTVPGQHDGIDLEKRERLIEKYDLMNFYEQEAPVLVSVDEFFEGNHDPSSIGSNLLEPPAIEDFYHTLKALSRQKEVQKVFVQINDVPIGDGRSLRDDAWFYSNTILIMGNMAQESVKQELANLQPDEVEYLTESECPEALRPYVEKGQIIYVWWD
ncbi:MAG: hypothetical protein AAF206_06930 [Bacteroidota bacterium]